MLKCPICSAENDHNERFCRACGQRLPTDRPPASSITYPQDAVAPLDAAPQAPIPQNMAIQAELAPAQGDDVPTFDAEPEPTESDEPQTPSALPGSAEQAAEPLQPADLDVEVELKPAAGIPPSQTPAADTAPESDEAAESTRPEATSDEPLQFDADRELEPTEPVASSSPATPPGPEPLSESQPVARPALSPVPLPPSAHQAPAPPPRIAPGVATGARKPSPGAALICPVCGRAGSAGERFCSDCGTQLVPVGPMGGPALCPSCGSEVDPADRFCKACGARLAGGAGVRIGPRLVLVSGGQERSFPLRTSGLTVGRGQRNDIPVPSDGYISGQHARVAMDADGAYVEDAGSTNGTFIRVRERHRLQDGDEIKVGQTILRYKS